MNYTFNLSLINSTIKEEYITLENCLKYTESIQDERKFLIFLVLLLIIYIFVLKKEDVKELYNRVIKNVN